MSMSGSLPPPIRTSPWLFKNAAFGRTCTIAYTSFLSTFLLCESVGATFRSW